MKKILVIRRVVGNSMLPVLRPGRVVIATDFFKHIRPEAVVVVRHDKIDKIKRIKHVKGGKIFVLGDNQRASLDSRSFGWLPTGSIVAKVFWPRV